MQNDVLHDTCYRTQLGRNDVFHRHRHEEYERRLGLFPRIQQKSKRKHSSSSTAHLMTSFDGDGVGLTLVFGDGGVDAVHDVRANRGFEDCGERDCCAIRGGSTGSEDVDLRTGGLLLLARNLTQIFSRKFHRCIHHQHTR